jgi:hypothetical protein
MQQGRCFSHAVGHGKQCRLPVFRAPAGHAYVITGGPTIFRLDLVSASGKETCSSGKSLFRLEGDTLQLAYYSGGKERPASFDGKRVVVSSFKREKK